MLPLVVVLINSLIVSSNLQRLRTLAEFRTMSIKPYPICVYRSNKWTEVQTDELLPGDIVSVTRSKDDCKSFAVDGSIAILALHTNVSFTARSRNSV